MARNRYDETWHRLREWTKGQTPSERLAAQILAREGFSDIDPSHPLGGKDGGKDATARKEGTLFAMAVYFPRGQQTFNTIKNKFEDDLAGVKRNSVEGVAFVTNQELTLGEREDIKTLAAPIIAELYHLERVTSILDYPDMAKIREQFLDIEAENSPSISLGGRGSAAPGGGGGRSGAIGPDAAGGPGGTGGNIINLDGTAGSAPGAGGGGAGAIGPGAIGGEGGGGGEYVSVSLGPDDTGPGSGFHHIEFRVGRSGAGPGDDTIVNLCAEDGHVLRSIVAQAGKSGAPPYVPPPSRSPTEEDLKAGLKVTAIPSPQRLFTAGTACGLSRAGTLAAMLYGQRPLAPIGSELAADTDPYVEQPVSIAVASARRAEDALQQTGETGRAAKRVTMLVVGVGVLGGLVAMAEIVDSRPNDRADIELAAVTSDIQTRIIAETQRLTNAPLSEIRSESAGRTSVTPAERQSGTAAAPPGSPTNPQEFMPPRPAVPATPPHASTAAPPPRSPAPPTPTLKPEGDATTTSQAARPTLTVNISANIRVSGEAGAAIVRVANAGERLAVFVRANGWVQVGPVGSDKPIGWIGASLTSPD